MTKCNISFKPKLIYHNIANTKAEACYRLLLIIKNLNYLYTIS
ncbi:hypothetical protein HMPREF1982_01550 [Clostridiales bacterium oral taxon 876 str. F0540]|nr:hypothetical protein HMPREF1982_01550 [Clostridiales bacterium oral taxon 876 str. F0540]